MIHLFQKARVRKRADFPPSLVVMALRHVLFVTLAEGGGASKVSGMHRFSTFVGEQGTLFCPNNALCTLEGLRMHGKGHDSISESSCVFRALTPTCNGPPNARTFLSLSLSLSLSSPPPPLSLFLYSVSLSLYSVSLYSLCVLSCKGLSLSSSLISIPLPASPALLKLPCTRTNVTLFYFRYSCFGKTKRVRLIVAEQRKAEQSRAEQSRIKRSRTSRPSIFIFFNLVFPFFVYFPIKFLIFLVNSSRITIASQ